MTWPRWYRVVEVVAGPLAPPAGLPRLLLGVLLLVALTDMLNAMTGRVCRDSIELEASSLFGGCYPWGFEGPFADFWYLRSQRNYLMLLAVNIVICTLGLLAPSALRRGGIGVILAWLALPAVVFSAPLANLFFVSS